MVMTARQMQRAASEIMNDVADLTGTLVRIGEKFGWDDPRIGRIEADIDRFTRRVNELRQQASRLSSAA